jgi:hypothetical protein
MKKLEIKLNASEIKQAIDWLKDCVWADMEANDFDELTPVQIERGISKHFSGGIESFKSTCNPIEVKSYVL